MKDKDRILSVDAKPDEVKVYPKAIEGKDYAPSDEVANCLRFLPADVRNRFLRF